MSEIGHAIDSVVDADLIKQLKGLGYRKNKRLLYIRSASHIKIVEIRAWRNLPRSGYFQVFAGVYFPDIAQALQRPPLKGLPHFINCTIWRDIGSLAYEHTSNKEDIVYKIELDLPTDLDALASKIGNQWVSYGRPWIDRVVNPIEAAEELARFKLYRVAAAIHSIYGSQDKVSELLALDEAFFAERDKRAKLFFEEYGFSP